jgi:hypothetical protein
MKEPPQDPTGARKPVDISLPHLVNDSPLIIRSAVFAGLRLKRGEGKIEKDKIVLL